MVQRHHKKAHTEVAQPWPASAGESGWVTTAKRVLLAPPYQTCNCGNLGGKQAMLGGSEDHTTFPDLSFSL